MEFTREFPDDAARLDQLWRERFAPDGHHTYCPSDKCQRPYDGPMYRRRAPLAYLAVLFAVIGGILLAKGSYVGGAILVVFSIIAAVGNYKDEDSSGLYG
jgi:hypothetical protein